MMLRYQSVTRFDMTGSYMQYIFENVKGWRSNHNDNGTTYWMLCGATFIRPTALAYRRHFKGWVHRIELLVEYSKHCMFSGGFATINKNVLARTHTLQLMH